MVEIFSFPRRAHLLFIYLYVCYICFFIYLFIYLLKGCFSDVTRRYTWSSAATGWQNSQDGSYFRCVYALRWHCTKSSDCQVRVRGAL